jgi:hypothetical protein
MFFFLLLLLFLNLPGGDITISNQKGMDQSLLNLSPPPSPDAPCRLGLYHFRFVSCMCPVWDVVITIFGRSFRVRVLVCLAVGPATIPRDLLGAEQYN